MSLTILNDPFSSDAITSISPLHVNADTVWDGFRLNKSLNSGLLRLNETKSESLPLFKSDILQLNLEDVPLPDLSSAPSISSSGTESEPEHDIQRDHEDDEAANIWILPDVIEKKAINKLLTWDTFLNRRHAELPSGYISEAGPRTFAAIVAAKSSTVGVKNVKSDVLLNAFFELGMGRSSALFDWNEQEHRFTRKLETFTAKGYSAHLLQDLFETTARVGTYSKALAETFQGSADLSSPCRVAFLAASRAALHAIHVHLETSRPAIKSLLQLKAIISKVEGLVTTLKQCNDAVQVCKTDDDLLSAVTRGAATASSSYPGVEEVLQSMFARTCRPLLEQLSSEIGLSTPGQAGDDGLSLGMTSPNEQVWNTVFHRDVSGTISETRQSLSLLKLYAPDCPVLVNSEYRQSSLSTLEIVYTINALSSLQARSAAYEDARSSLLTSAKSSTTTSLLVTPASDSFGLDGPDPVQFSSDDPFQLDLDFFAPGRILLGETEQDELQERVMCCLESSELDDTPFQVDIEQALPLSVTPLISAQHRILSYAVLELLFQEYNLIEHINMQRHFHFLSNAFFSSRLGIALFDPDQRTGDTQRRTGGATGLRLQSRDTWPPASSELRLVLMGILSDSLVSSTDRSVEDSISFAIRDMSSDELEKCRDVDSIHALDFLRLQYKPPDDVLGTVLTPDALEKYDRVFQLLLRILRVHKLTQSMLRESEATDHQVVFEMHHFITTLADYCHNTAIELHWRKFEDVLRNVKAHLANKDYDNTLRMVKSQDYLRVLHERTLDSILHGLFLKKRESSVRRLLDEILSTILLFAAHRRQTHNADDTADGFMVKRKELQARFRDQVKRFMDALGSQSQAEAPSMHQGFAGQDLTNNDVNLPEYLLLRLDMSGYWTRKSHGRGISYVDL
ncbi:hypothetical protein LTR46_003755 [Exophiala xenobiotica]|nr:hypothetical protein LTR46_003755 [Exophiala xenobiotica]